MTTEEKIETYREWINQFPIDLANAGKRFNELFPKPKRRFYYMGCCDCGLVHKLEFKLIKRGARAYIFFRAWRDEAKTRRLRKRGAR